jgi:hypothetical protein
MRTPTFMEVTYLCETALFSCEGLAIETRFPITWVHYIALKLVLHRSRMSHTLPFCRLHFSQAPIFLVVLYADRSATVILRFFFGCAANPSTILNTCC